MASLISYHLLEMSICCCDCADFSRACSTLVDHSLSFPAVLSFACIIGQEGVCSLNVYHSVENTVNEEVGDRGDVLK